MNKNKILYKLSTKDFQNVAFHEIDRELTAKEIEIVKSSLENNIPWYDLIANSISENKLSSRKMQ
jgi:hypothetical protein